MSRGKGHPETRTVYSYVRFSQRKQRKGDSYRRQLEWGKKICEEKGWKLEEGFRLEDLGVSAFRGKNKTRGSLGAFLQAIEEGRVKSGSILLLESLDRLSREDIDPAWEVFRSIL